MVERGVRLREVADAWASGSSIMPQKKNPDAAELLRAKAPRIVAHLTGLHGVMHGLPLTYNKDLQEDKEHLFDAVDTLELSLAAATGMLGGDRLRPRAARRRGRRRADRRHRRRRPARPARRAVPPVARDRRRARARDARRRASRSPTSRGRSSRRHSPELDDEFYALLSQRAWLESKVSEGGTALPRVREQLERARADARPGEPRASTSAASSRSRRTSSAASCATARRAGVIVETEAYHESEPACHAHVGLTGAHAHPVRPAGARLRLPLLRDPRAVQRRLRGRGRRRRGADPRAGAARGARPDARAARAASATRTSAPARAS